METLLGSTSGDLAGAAVGAVALAVAILGGSAHFRGVTYFGYVLSITACLGVSTYSMLGTSISIEITKTDTYDFYLAAQQIYLGVNSAESISIGPSMYAYIWSGLFAIFGPSPFLTNNIGILSFAVACLVVGRIYVELNGRSESTVPVLIFVLSPATIFHASLSWREPHQILALALATLYALRYIRQGNTASLALSLVFLVAGSLIHNKIILFNFAFAMSLFVCAALGRSYRIAARRGVPILGGLVAPVALTLALGASYLFLLTDTGVIAKVVTEGGVQESLQEWRSAAGGRTKFLWDMDFESVGSMVVSFPLVLFQFLVAPLVPFYPESVLDFAAAAEGVVRVALLLLIAKRLTRSRRGEWWEIAFLVMAYFAYCAIVALGTGNAGTALRHQIKVSWLLVLICGPIAASAFTATRRPAVRSRRKR